MVAVIKTGHSIYRIVNYNENKAKEGVAECIGAANYPVDHEKMSINMKLKHFLKRMELNENVKRNSVHISLNFDVSEHHLSQGKLMNIADAYMDKLGFEKQPYLIYQHHDAGHPHIHIVTTNIEADGKRIDLHHLGIRKSEPARKYIEKVFGLVRAEEQKKQESKLEAIAAQRVQYGKSQTKRAIQNVLDHVIGQYKYTSLPELNAVLKQYNVQADRGSENSRVFQHKGLLYRVLDADGKPVGVPIKASAFYSKPTLQNLEIRFKENESKRMPHKAMVKNAVDLALLGKERLSMEGLSRALDREGVSTVFRKNPEGLVYGITYVDHRTKCVFNGSALGKKYSAKAIQERCRQEAFLGQKEVFQQSKNQQISQQGNAQKGRLLWTLKDSKYIDATIKIPDLEKAVDKIMQPEDPPDFLPYQLKRNKKKKRRKKGIPNNQ